MAELVPPDGEQLERVNEVADDWDVPEAEDYNRHCDYLLTGRGSFCYFFLGLQRKEL